METPDNRQTTAGTRNPGDEAAPGTEQTGEMTCPMCQGSGKAASGMCINCGGTGLVVVTIGDA